MDSISKLTIEGFRLFKASRTIEFQKPDNDKIGLNVIVGSNNVGKSSVLNLIGTGYYNQVNREDWTSDSPKIIVDAGDKKGIIQYSKNQTNPTIIQEPEGQWPNIISMYLPSDRRWAFEASNVYMGMLGGNPNPTDTDRINQLYQVSQNVSNNYGSNQNFEETRKPNQNFLSTLLVISESDNLTEKYTDLVREFIPNYTGFELLRQRGNKYQALYRSTQSNQVIDMALVGDGVQTIMVICAYLLLIRESQAGAINGIQQQVSMLVLDEPEASLHPQAQKKLYEYIKEISRNVQVIMATHSPYMISWDIIPKGAKIIRIASSDGEQAEVYELSRDKHPDIRFTTQPRRQHNLDIISREIVFADRVLMVEGLDDANILREYILSEHIRANFEICGHGADGAGSILNWLKLATALGIKPSAIYDNDSVADYQMATAVYGTDLIQKWTTDDIRDKPKDKTPKVGLFNEDGTIKASSKQEVEGIIQTINTALV
ncbi:AAA family ATPase [Candidatus Saccharibacteria bacterium]|nr:MAG: AAA family ATPase [Candidatus Saccharibacteria bacterium]